MATPPTRVLSATPAAGWSTSTSPQTTPVFDVQAGDLLTLLAFSENEKRTISTPTWTGSGTWTAQRSFVLLDWSTAYLFTCLVTATATGRTVSVAGTVGTPEHFGFIVTAWRNHGGVGVTGIANASGAPSLALICSANSAISVGNSDWNAANGASRVWRTVNGAPIVESSYGGTVGADYVNYTGYVLDVGAAGSKTVGLTAPSGQKYSIVAVEILGVAGGGSFSGSASLSGAGALTASGSPRITGTTVLGGSGALTTVGTPNLGGTVILTGAGTLSTVGGPAVGGTIVLSGSGTLALSGSSNGGSGLDLNGSGSLSTVGTPKLAGATSLAGQGTLVGTGTASSATSGAVLLSGVGTLETSGEVRVADGASLSSTGILEVVGAVSVAAVLTLGGSGALGCTSGVPQAHLALTATLSPRTFAAMLGTERRTTGKLQPNRWAGRLK